MSEHATQLSVILVDEIFGELPSRIFGTLTFHGRLPFLSLVQYTKLSPTEVRHSLSILIQQHLVLWYDADNPGQALYEADVPASYMLARSGKYIHLVENRLGKIASQIISDLLILGHVRVGDLTSTYFPSSDGLGPLHELIGMGHPSHSDGDQSIEVSDLWRKDACSIDTLRSAISDLMAAGLLCPVHESHFRSIADNITEAEQVVPRDSHIKSKREEQAAWELAVTKKLEDWRYGSKEGTDAFAETQKCTKRVFQEGDDRPNGKRRKLMDMHSNGIDDAISHPYTADVGLLHSDLTLRVNHERLAVIMRNDQLVAHVKESIGTTTAKVYDYILRSVESQLRNCKNDLDNFDGDNETDLLTLPHISTEELSSLIQDLPDLADTLGYADPRKINLNLLEHPKKVKRRPDPNDPDEEAVVEGFASSDVSENESNDSRSETEGIDHDSDSSNEDADYSPKPHNCKTPDTTPDTTPKSKDPESPYHSLRQHLLLLTEHSNRFLIHIPRDSATPERWAIPYRTLSRTLLHNALLSITTSRFGPLASRLLRILGAASPKNFSPKLDEKTLVLLSLIPQKPMRTLLHSMHRAGHIELQELPKDGNQRRPGTTLFFWFFDADRMRKKVLEETYKAMANLIRRARVEREGVRGVVEKSERTDVVGREEEFLGEEELRALREWREKEERIWGEVGRLDDLVAVLRDF